MHLFIYKLVFFVHLVLDKVEWKTSYPIRVVLSYTPMKRQNTRKLKINTYGCKSQINMMCYLSNIFVLVFFLKKFSMYYHFYFDVHRQSLPMNGKKHPNQYII